MAGQLSYSKNMDEAFAGMPADSRDSVVETFGAVESIPFGRGVSGEAGDTVSIVKPKKDLATLVFDADFVTSNTVDGKVNGVAWTQVTFATDHDTTAALLVAAIAALDGVDCQLDSSDSNNRTFLVEIDGVAITLSDVVVAAGGSQAGDTTTYSSNDVFRGISRHSFKQADSDGVSQYLATEAVGVVRKGVFWIETGVAVTADETAYVDLAGGIGKFTNVSTNNMATGGTFRSTVATAGLAKLEINL